MVDEVVEIFVDVVAIAVVTEVDHQSVALDAVVVVLVHRIHVHLLLAGKSSMMIST